MSEPSVHTDGSKSTVNMWRNSQDPVDLSDTLLIDTSEPEPPPIPPHPDLIDSHNGSLAEVVAERESLIDALHGELEAMRAEVQRARSQATHNEEQLRLRINDLESTIAELDSELLAERQSRESILAQVEAAAASAEAVTRLATEETRRRTAEEKFVKMKDVYQKLRDEHINLIRSPKEIWLKLADDQLLLSFCMILDSRIKGFLNLELMIKMSVQKRSVGSYPSSMEQLIIDLRIK
ncbi:uncharacterized protein LOC119570898, partial [Penaeus monodon]|uniref:uncharacterized protein LOC119570898 n=1 Tax=Penaeus monodon TaxID=6687 RepID=UPI0018A75BE3